MESTRNSDAEQGLADSDVLADSHEEVGPARPRCPEERDGGPVADWPGWRRVSEFDPCCRIDVPMDVAKEVPPLDWIPCTNGMVGCTELKGDWVNDGGFAVSEASHDEDGKPSILRFMRFFTKERMPYEDDMYDLRIGQPLLGIRTDTSGRFCHLVLLPTPHGLVFFGGLFDPSGPFSGTFVSERSVRELGGPLHVRRIGTGTDYGPKPKASDTTLAFEIQPGGPIGRHQLGSSTLTRSHTPIALLFDFLERDDVYARSNYGTMGWQQEYRIDPDGSVTLYRGPPMVHASTFRTDGRIMFWIESSGDPKPDAVQPKVEIWSAPYTSDPKRLNETAHKLAVVKPSGYKYFFDAAAFEGHYAVVLGGNVAAVVRASDGAVQYVSTPEDFIYNDLFIVSPTELWGRFFVKQGLGRHALARVALRSGDSERTPVCATRYIRRLDHDAGRFTRVGSSPSITP